MKPIFVGIAGGSGSGKSTLGFGLMDMFPNDIGLLQLDDYQRKREELSMVDGLPNWDDPAAINFTRLLEDINALEKGETINVQTKSERFNPEYKEKGRISFMIAPKRIMLLEGYLALWDKHVRSKLHSSIFLDLPDELRVRRRTKFIDPVYIEKILLPMHHQYIEPTKQYATHIIEVGGKSKEKVLYEAKEFLVDLGIISP